MVTKQFRFPLTFTVWTKKYNGSQRELKLLLIKASYFVLSRKRMTYRCVNVTLDHKTSQNGCIWSNSQQDIVWVKIIIFLFYAKNH